MGWFKRAVVGTGLVLFMVSLLDQLGRRPADRDWHGAVLGVPYDYRRPTVSSLRERFWNPDDERIFTPHVFGIGWSVNLYQVVRRAGLLIA